MALTQRQERRGLVRRQLDELGGRGGIIRAGRCRDRFTLPERWRRTEDRPEVGQRRLPVWRRMEHDGPRGADARFPVLRQQTRRRLWDRIDVARPRILVVVRGFDVRRPGRLPYRRGVPQGGKAVQPGGHVIVGKRQSVLCGEPVGAEQD